MLACLQERVLARPLHLTEAHTRTHAQKASLQVEQALLTMSKPCRRLLVKEHNTEAAMWIVVYHLKRLGKTNPPLRRRRAASLATTLRLPPTICSARRSVLIPRHFGDQSLHLTFMMVEEVVAGRDQIIIRMTMRQRISINQTLLPSGHIVEAGAATELPTQLLNNPCEWLLSFLEYLRLLPGSNGFFDDSICIVSMFFFLSSLHIM